MSENRNDEINKYHLEQYRKVLSEINADNIDLAKEVLKRNIEIIEKDIKNELSLFDGK